MKFISSRQLQLNSPSNSHFIEPTGTLGPTVNLQSQQTPKQTHLRELPGWKGTSVNHLVEKAPQWSLTEGMIELWLKDWWLCKSKLHRNFKPHEDTHFLKTSHQRYIHVLIIYTVATCVFHIYSQLQLKYLSLLKNLYLFNSP